MKLKELKKSQFIKLVYSLMLAKFPGYKIMRNVKAVSGLIYQLDVVCECYDGNGKLLQRIIIVCEKHGEPIEVYDVQALEEYVKDLKELDVYEPKRDKVWFLLDTTMDKEAKKYYKTTKPKFKIFDENWVLDQIEKYKNRKEAKLLRERIAIYGIER
jgi:hypothetical protein